MEPGKISPSFAAILQVTHPEDLGPQAEVERGGLDVVPGLCKLIEDKGVDEIGLNPGAIHALWALEGLGALSGDAAGIDT